MAENITDISAASIHVLAGMLMAAGEWTMGCSISLVIASH